MTTEEHEMMILMLARAYQAIEALANVLKSREIMTADDLNAFQFAAWADHTQIVKVVTQARSDYLHIAKLSGVEGLPEF